MAKTRRRNKAREPLWQDSIAAWRQFGQSVRVFCHARGVSEATFLAGQLPARAKEGLKRAVDI
jgi:hypothetical protein